MVVGEGTVVNVRRTRFVGTKGAISIAPGARVASWNNRFERTNGDDVDNAGTFLDEGSHYE